MTMWVVMLLVIGTGLGFLRFVLDDKWNVLPKSLCRFCATWWLAIALSVLFYFTGFTIWLCPFTALPITVIASISYVYIKNAN